MREEPDEFGHLGGCHETGRRTLRVSVEQALQIRLGLIAAMVSCLAVQHR